MSERAQQSGDIHREPMAKVDTAWLRMERPTNLMMITGVLILTERLDLQRLQQVIARRFLAYPRFRHKAVDLNGTTMWEQDDSFDLDRHVVAARLPDPAGQAELQALASELASTPLDRARPLWQFHLVERCDGGSAVVCRIHHCYADGIALVRVILSMTDPTRRARAAAVATGPVPEAAREVPAAAHGLGLLQEPIELAWKVGGKIVETGLDLSLHPTHAAAMALDGGQIATDLVHALSLPDDPDTLLRGELDTGKRCAWAEPLDLDEVKAIGRAIGCTVNDVMLAAAAGALRSHLLGRGEAVDGLTIRATVPVNLRPLDQAHQLGNQFGLVFLDLPIGEHNPIRRVELVAERMCELKQSKQALVTYGVLAALGMAPMPVQRMVTDMLSRKASLVATNVPGPQVPLYLGGAAIGAMVSWVPQTGGIGLGLSILSYHGKMHFGIMADRRRVPDPDDITRRFRPEFEKLLYATLMEDWSTPVRSENCAATLAHYG